MPFRALSFLFITAPAINEIHFLANSHFENRKEEGYGYAFPPSSVCTLVMEHVVPRDTDKGMPWNLSNADMNSEATSGVVKMITSRELRQKNMVWSDIFRVDHFMLATFIRAIYGL